MKNIIQSLFFVMLSSLCLGQIWEDPLNGVINPNTNPLKVIMGEFSEDGVFVADHLTVSGIGRGSGTSGAGNADGIYRVNFSASQTIDLNAYFHFTLTPSSDHKINFGSFTYVGNGTGAAGNAPPQQFAFRSSLDNFTANIGAPDLDGTTIDLTGSQFQNITSTITFRLYGWAATTSPPGPHVWSIEEFSFDGAIALPVIFDKIEAFRNANTLHVKWTTNSEVNSDYFEVQASKDGKEFTTFKTVQSAGDHSDTLQHYEVSIGASDIASLLSLSVLLGLLSLGFNRRKRILLSFASIAILLANIIACSKQESVDTFFSEKVFIRIKQVDIDGAFRYSNVVQVINK